MFSEHSVLVSFFNGFIFELGRVFKTSSISKYNFVNVEMSTRGANSLISFTNMIGERFHFLPIRVFRGASEIYFLFADLFLDKS
jgi:hypothetical protein